MTIRTTAEPQYERIINTNDWLGCEGTIFYHFFFLQNLEVHVVINQLVCLYFNKQLDSYTYIQIALINKLSDSEIPLHLHGSVYTFAVCLSYHPEVKWNDHLMGRET